MLNEISLVLEYYWGYDYITWVECTGPGEGRKGWRRQEEELRIKRRRRYEATKSAIAS